MAAPNMNNPRALSLQRLLIGHAQEMVLDSHGRLALTPELREFAGLARAAWMVGQGRRLELWDEARWKMQRDVWMKSEQGAEEAAPGLSVSLRVTGVQLPPAAWQRASQRRHREGRAYGS